MAEALREGKVGRNWDEISAAAERRLTVRPHLVPAKPKFVKLERAEPVSLSRQRTFNRNDKSVIGRHTAQSNDGGGRGR
jgi:hypothetical protein